MPRLRKGRKSLLRSRAFQVTALALLLLVAGIAVLGPRAKRRFDRWSASRHVGRALAFYSKGDFQRATLDARSALELNRLDTEAIRVMAKSLEALGAPSAIQWRRHFDSIRPGDAENTIAWAKDAMLAGDAATAEQVLGTLKAGDRSGALFHDVMAGIALVRRDTAGAEAHWAESAKLDPAEERYRLNLATLHLQSRAPGVREAALEILKEMSAKPGKRSLALGALLGDAMNQGDAVRAKELADALGSDPQAPFADKLKRLETLRALRDPQATPWLLQLRDSAIPNPGNLYELLTWMNEHSLAMMVAEWVPQLPADLVAKPPVCLAVADARARSLEWERLEEMTDAASWGEFDHLREAYLARAMDQLHDPNRAEKAWDASLQAAGTRADAMERLVKLAIAWGWERRAEDALWKLSANDQCPRWARETLWSITLGRADTQQLLRVAKLIADADPRSTVSRNNVVFLGLLTRSPDSTLHAQAESLHQETPGDPVVAATYGLSLYLRNRGADALAMMQRFSPAQLRQPGVARQYGILLLAAGRAEEAVEFLKLEEKGIVLPEETALVEQAKTNASRGTSDPPRQPGDK